MLFRVIAILLSGLLLTGCGAAVVAGAAGAGYYVGKDERTVGQITDDATITTRINAKYARDDLIKVIDINVDTYMSLVTLYGPVANRKTADRAVSLAKSVNGVKKVISKLTIQ